MHFNMHVLSGRLCWLNRLDTLLQGAAICLVFFSLVAYHCSAIHLLVAQLCAAINDWELMKPPRHIGSNFRLRKQLSTPLIHSAETPWDNSPWASGFTSLKRCLVGYSSSKSGRRERWAGHGIVVACNSVEVVGCLCLWPHCWNWIWRVCVCVRCCLFLNWAVSILFGNATVMSHTWC